MSDNHTFDPEGSGSTYLPTTNSNGQSEVLTKNQEARKIVRRCKTKQRAIREVREKFDMSKAASTRLVDRLYKDLYSYEEYKKKEVRDILIADIEEQMLIIQGQVEQIQEQLITEQDPRTVGSLRFHLKEFLNTYDKFVVQLHKFYPGAINLGETEDQRPTVISIDKIVVESPNREDL